MLDNAQVMLISVGISFVISFLCIGGAILLTKWAFSGSEKYFH